MSQQITVKIDLKEIYNLMCPKCRKKLLRYIKEKIDEETIKRLMGLEEK